MKKNKRNFLRVGRNFLLFSFTLCSLSLPHVKAIDLADNKGVVDDIYKDSFNDATKKVDELMTPKTGDEAPDFKYKRGVKTNEGSVIDAENIPTTSTIDINDLNSKVQKTEPKKTPLVSGGNRKATNIIATLPSKSRGTIIENVNENAEDITPKDEPEEEAKKEVKEETEKQKIPMRQFLTFTTQGGKEFHLIVNYDKEGNEQVQMLTEVSEQDLLNSIEGESVEDKRRQAEEKERLEREIAEERAKQEAEELKRKQAEEANKPKKKTPWLMYLIGLLAVAGMAYYQFVYKRQNDSHDDGEDYDDYDDEDYDE